jgi:3-isopropylmalate/(R)-2-methylmalate dehydratase small subunit
LVHLGVAAVIAPSYNGLYFRNAFNVGLLLLTCPQADLLQEGERLVLEPQGSGVVSTLSGRLACEPVPDFLMAMVRAGGLFNQLKQRLAAPPASPPATPSTR